MFKKISIIINLILIISITLSSSVFAANITVDLYVGETSQTYVADTATASIVSSSIATMDFTPAVHGMQSNYTIDELLGYAFNIKKVSTGHQVDSNGIYMYIYGDVFRPNVTTITMQDEGGGKVSFRRNNNVITYENGQFSVRNGLGHRSKFYLYQYTTNEAEYSNEIPGFKRLTTFPDGTSGTNLGSFLIVMEDGNTMTAITTDPSGNAITVAQEVNQAGSVSFTGVTSGTTYATVGNDYYTINVYGPTSDVFDDEIEIEVGETYQINPKIAISEYYSENTGIATVNQTTGLVTGVSAGKTNIIAKTSDGKLYKIPTTVYNNIYDISITVDTDTHTKVYYSKNGEALSQVSNGTTVTERQPQGVFKAYNFYGVPDPGYALVRVNNNMTPVVNSTASEIQNGVYTSYIGSQISALTANTVSTNVSSAKAQGAEGVNGIIRTTSSTGDANETVVLRSEKLPTMGVNIYSVGGSPYTSGMKARTGETIIYEVSIDKDEAGQYLVIEDGTLASALPGATYIGTSPTGNSAPNDVDIGAGTTLSGKYYFSYTIPNNASGTITNNVTFNYDTYSANSDTSNNVSYKTARVLNGSTDIQIDNKSSIIFSNRVYGNTADQDKYFKYKIDIDVANGETFTITGQDATINYEGQTINTQTTFVKGQDNYIYLKNGQTATIIVDSASGTNYVGQSYEIEQLDGSDYETKIDGVVRKKTSGLTIPRDDTVISFTNFRELAPATDMTITIIPFAIIIVFSLMGFIIIKRKKEDE